MYYILVNQENNFVDEVIASSHPDFPNVPLSERYTKEFIETLIPSETNIPLGWVFDPNTKTFSQPICPEPVEAVQTEPVCDDSDDLKMLRGDISWLKEKFELLEKQIETLQGVKQ